MHQTGIIKFAATAEISIKYYGYNTTQQVAQSLNQNSSMVPATSTA